MASHPQRRFDTADGAAGEPPQGLVAMLVGPRLESLHLLPGSQPAVRLSRLCRKRKAKRRPVRENPCRVCGNAPHGQKQGRCAADMTNVRNKLVGCAFCFQERQTYKAAMSAVCCAGRSRTFRSRFPSIFEITTLREVDSSAAVAGSMFAAGKKIVPPSGGLYIDIF